MEDTSNPAQSAKPGVTGSFHAASTRSEPVATYRSVKFLDFLSRDALRFENESFASVLCDENGSSTSLGHIMKF